MSVTHYTTPTGETGEVVVSFGSRWTVTVLAYDGKGTVIASVEGTKRKMDVLGPVVAKMMSEGRVEDVHTLMSTY